MLDASAVTGKKLRQRSLINFSRMGHCAPSIMQTLLDVSGTEAEWLVKMTAGLPGGIGNTGDECGGITAALLLLGLRCGREADVQGLPMVVYKGHDLLRRFRACQGSTSCREIRGDDRVPFRCVGVVRQGPTLCAQTLCSDCTGSLAEEQQNAYARLSAHWAEQGFHCAQTVLRAVEPAAPPGEEMLHASSGFLGGMAFTGMTCSAFTAGVMALGLQLGEIENSRLRVLRMIGRMAVGHHPFDDDVNAFNKIMNLGHRLSRWFAATFGSTQCRSITQCDFSTAEGARRYIETGGTARCRAIAQSVAHEVREIIRSEAPRAGPTG